VRHVLELDRANGNTYWADAMRKEQAGINPAFDFQEKGGPKPVGYEAIQGHTIFDVKPDLTRKARFVAQGNRTEPTVELTYASVVSRDSVRIVFLLAALNDMSVLCADVGNAYINAPCRGKYCILCGPEFGPAREGCWAILVRVLYGLRTSAASWRTHLYQVLERDLGFTACPVDPDVLMRTATRVDGRKYYEYLLVHTDDLLVISEKPQRILDDVDSHFKLKAVLVEAPRKYLGAAISQFALPQTGQEVWAMSLDDYLKEALKNVKAWLSERGLSLKGKVSSVLPYEYRPELDVSEELDDDLFSYYNSLIGVLRWAVELGRIDIAVEVSMLSSHLACPRVGHLDAVFHIFSYLNQYNKSILAFDPSKVSWSEADQVDYNWSDFYGDEREAIPPNAPVPLGESVQMTVFVDADHAGNLLTRRSRTGVLVYLNRSPILWYTKQQSMVETS
jgi:Reverse transcriptase (RNA-dependent DNA polymerase)